MTAATDLRSLSVQAMVRRYVPEGKSLVDELISDRRAEAELFGATASCATIRLRFGLSDGDL